VANNLTLQDMHDWENELVDILTQDKAGKLNYPNAMKILTKIRELNSRCRIVGESDISAPEFLKYQKHHQEAIKILEIKYVHIAKQENRIRIIDVINDGIALSNKIRDKIEEGAVCSWSDEYLKVRHEERAGNIKKIHDMINHHYKTFGKDAYISNVFNDLLNLEIENIKILNIEIERRMFGDNKEDMRS
jgi:hypothetical protein